jgi:HlyD family secretion protein
VTKTVSASGTLQPLQSVTIGSQLSGQVKQVLVDFNSVVKKGQVLAVIDTETFANKVRQSQAAVATAQADLRVAEADYQRQKRLAAADLVSDKTAEDAAAARAKAAAQLQQARAALASDQADLARAEIKSPIDGIVVNRTIDPGQTVAASFSAPELFVIANDLSKLEINILVDEADIGEVREGELVKFTVDAFPDENFQGRVTQVRKQASTTNNVVTYQVIAEADNPDRKLLPGMTANADIVVEQHNDVLAAPAAGLRWRPADAKPENAAQGGARIAQSGAPAGGLGGGAGGGQRRAGILNADQLAQQLNLDSKQKAELQSVVSASRQRMQAVFMSANGDRDAIRAAMRKERENTNENITKILRPDQAAKFAALRAQTEAQRGGLGPPRTIYVLKNNKPVAVQVRTGASDGTVVEVAGDIKEGDLVITGGGPEPKTTPQNRVPGIGGFGPRRVG